MAIREQLIPTWGQLWDQSPLNPVVVKEEEYEGCTLRYVQFQASTGVYVPGALLIPAPGVCNGRGVLCVHQHAGQWHLGKSEPIGKAGNPDMFYALELAQRGYITFSIDLLAFEERGLNAASGDLNGRDYERFLATELTMYGSTLKGRYVWDLHRALDFLGEQPEVKSPHFGAIGHSLGGQSVLDIMCYDQRIAVGVCSCGISTWQSILRDRIIHNMAAYAPGMLQVADTDAIVASLAPRAFYMSSGENDRIFPIDGVRQIGALAAKAYADFGVPERFHQRVFTGGHGFPHEVRMEAYAWLDQWLS